MTEKIKKPIANVTINYEDGTHDTMQYYAMIGLNGDTWYTVMLSPPKQAVKIKMNNLLVDLNQALLESAK
jgi:hypothetical protein